MSESTEASRAQLERFEAFLEQDPQNVRLLEDTADLLFSLGRVREARTRIEAALAQRREDKGLRAKLATILLGSGNPEGAYTLLRELISEGVLHPAIRFNLAYAAFSAGRPADALEYLDEIPDGERAQVDRFQYLRALALYYARRNDEALTEIDSYMVAHPEDFDGLALKAQVVEDSGRLAEAAEIAGMVLSARPDDPAANLVLGEVALFMQQPDVAEPYLQKVLGGSPTNGRAWSALGFVCVERRQIDQAIDCFKKAVAHMPDHLGTWHGLAWCQILRSDLVGARQSVDKAMQVERTFADNHGTLGVIFFLEGKIEEAQQATKRGIRLNPKSAASLFAQSLLLSAKGDQAAGQQSIRKIFEGRQLPNGVSVEQAIGNHLSAIARQK